MNVISTERAILVAFLGSYLVNNVAAALATFVKVSDTSSLLNAQYISFVIISAIVIAIVTWWYMRPLSKMRALASGISFGVLGFVVAVVTSFITGIAGVLLQTGSFSTLLQVLPNFVPYLFSVSTGILLLTWVIPAALVGWFQRSRGM